MKDITNSFVSRTCALVMVLIALTCPVWGQGSTAQISGAVKDQTGAVLPGVEVTATQTDTGLVRNAVTDETGSYVITNLPVGPYKFEAGLPGFKTYVQTGIVLQVNSNPIVNAILEVGQVSDQIEVQANAALVETRSTGVSQVMDNTRVLELPLNGRQVTDLILLSGMASVSNVNKLDSQGSRSYPVPVIAVGGGMENGITFLLDGGNHNDPSVALNLPMPFPDAMQEFKVETSGLQAQYGFHSAGVVNSVTKSGTNQFHGDLFEFVRYGPFNARNAFAPTNDGLKRNQFGGTIGGPIMKNKLFFFAGNQTTTQRATPTTQRSFIPTAAMIAGDFTTIASAACTSGRPVTLSLPFSGNQVSPSLFSPAAMNLLKNKLFPTTSDPCGQIQYGRRAGFNEYITVGKIDYQMSEKQSLFGRYMEARRNIPTDFDGVNILSLSDGILSQPVYSFVLGHTYLLGAGTVSSFRGTFNRAKTEKHPPEFFTLTDLGVKGVFESIPHFTQFSVSNGFGISGSKPNPGHYNGISFQLAEDLSLVRGAHQYGVGGTFIHMNFNGNSGVQRAAAPSFNGMFTGMGLADFMLGKVSSFKQGAETVSNSRQHYVGLYAQDTWKATPRLTVNAGLRWEPYFAAYNARGVQGHFDKELFDQGVHSTVFKNAPAGLMFPYLGDPGFKSKSYSQNAMLHFAPRLGFAFDPKGDGRMTVRAAYGVLFDLSHLYNFSGVGIGSPYGNNVSLDNVPGGFDDPWQGYPGGNPFPILATPDAKFPIQTAYVSYRKDMKAPYVHQWNLSVQRQIGSDWLVSANYIGNSTIHVYGLIQVNQPIFMPGASCFIAGKSYFPCSSTSNINQRRTLYLQNPTEGQYYGAVAEIDDGGTAHYDALLLSVQRRAARGLTIQTNYTWGHCNGDTLYPVGGDTGGIYPGRRGDERRDCPGDQRQNLSMSTVYATPQFSSPALRVLASDWQISGIFRGLTGDHFQVSSGFDTALTGTLNNTRANQILGDPFLPNKSVNGWLNSAAFSRPGSGEWGNSSNDIAGPGSIVIDVSLTRTFKIVENQTLQFRAEAFNMPNHLNPGDPINAINNQNFGKILTAKDPRIMQLALKYVF